MANNSNLPPGVKMQVLGPDNVVFRGDKGQFIAPPTDQWSRADPKNAPKVTATQPKAPPKGAKMQVVGPDQVVWRGEKGQFVAQPGGVYKSPSAVRKSELAAKLRAEPLYPMLREVNGSLESVVKAQDRNETRFLKERERNDDFRREIGKLVRKNDRRMDAVRTDVQKIDYKTNTLLREQDKIGRQIGKIAQVVHYLQVGHNTLVSGVVRLANSRPVRPGRGGHGGGGGNPGNPSPPPAPPPAVPPGILEQLLTPEALAALKPVTDPLVQSSAAWAAGTMSTGGIQGAGTLIDRMGSMEPGMVPDASRLNPTASNDLQSFSSLGPGRGESGSASSAMAHFIAKGYKPEWAAGVVGNLQEESGHTLRTNAVGDGGLAYGIAQWHPPRQKQFQQIFGKNIRDSTFKEQLDFVHWELQNTHKNAMQKLMACKDEIDAAVIVDQFYEQSAGHARRQRASNSRQLMSAYKRDGVQTSPASLDSEAPNLTSQNTQKPAGAPSQNGSAPISAAPAPMASGEIDDASFMKQTMDAEANERGRPDLLSGAGSGGKPELANPVPGAPVTSGFGSRVSPTGGASSDHKGVDFGVGIGTQVGAAGRGRVVSAGSEGGYGNQVTIEHDGGVRTRYAHLSKIGVKVGQTVSDGWPVGLSGGVGPGAGTSTGPHLHFETMQGSNPVDPSTMLAGLPSAAQGRGRQSAVYDTASGERSAPGSEHGDLLGKISSLVKSVVPGGRNAIPVGRAVAGSSSSASMQSGRGRSVSAPQASMIEGPLKAAASIGGLVVNILQPQSSQPRYQEAPSRNFQPDRYDRNRVPSAMPDGTMLRELFDLRGSGRPERWAFGR